MRNLFPGFYNRTEEELSKLWQEGIFVFDTNMLLNIYRYAPKTRDRYFEILDLLKRRNQLWIPYQAAYEYQDRRMDVIRGQLDPYTKVGNILQTTWQTLDSALEPYKSKHGFINTTELAEQLVSTIKTAKDTVTQSSDKYKQYKQENEALKKQDKLLEKIEEFFQGNIGNPYTRKRLEELYRLAQLRVELRIPPGWEDEGKNSFKSYGDIVLWFQLIDYARTKKRSIVFVTDDGKKDWWIRDTKGKPIRPLPALVQEMFVEASVLLHMYQGYEFIEAATQFFKLEAQPEIIEEAKEITARNTVEASQVKVRAPGRLYAGDVIQRIVQEWLESIYPASQIIQDYQKSLEHRRLDFLMINPDGTRTGVEVKYFQVLTHLYNVVSDILSIIGKGQELVKMIVFIVTGDFSYAVSILEMLKDKIFIPENVSLVIGHIEPDFQFYHVATLPWEP